MELNGEEKVGMFAIGCVAIVLALLISCITYYSLEKNKTFERMVEKGVNPAIMECVDIIKDVPDHQVCSNILTNHDLSGVRKD